MELPGRIMALDVGDARTGVAVTDPSQTIVSPHAVVQQPSRDKAIAEILEMVDALEPILIVSGLPLLVNGDEGPQARRVRNFMALLAERTEVPVVFEDERYSTLAADEVFHARGGKGRKRKDVIDKIAAAQILSSYLEGREARRAAVVGTMSSEDLIESARKNERKKFRFWRWMISLVLYGIAGAVVIVAAAAGVGYMLYDHVTSPGVKGPAVELGVPKGSTGRDVGKLLADAGLVEYEGFFRLALQLDKSGKHIQHGNYTLNQGLSALELLHQLQEGPSKPLDADRIKITIPEGLAIAQIAEMRPDGEAYIRAASNPVLISALGLQAESLEGYLMPDTYFFDQEPDADALVERQIGHFEAVYGELLKALPGSEALDRTAVLTIASLVEEEARVEEERAMIAAVLYNRLKLGMPLQMDSTLQYALGKYGQRMLNEDKEVDSPYNTYRNPGLPPGPISSPGAASIRAALAPAEVEYLYFVSNADGKTHTFSANLKDHEAAVARYRREIAVQRREQVQ